MSLLLDALKKAAQQKAQKSQLELSADRASDETLFDVAAASSSPSENADSSLLPDAGDETEFDHSELGVRLDRTGRERGAADETGLDLADTSETGLEQDQPDRSAGDETGLDIPDATQTRNQQELPDHGSSEDTCLDIPDATQTRNQQELPDHGSSEETSLDIPVEAEVDAADLSEPLPSGENEIIISGTEESTSSSVEETPVMEDQVSIVSDDETDLSEIGGDDDDGAIALADELEVVVDNLQEDETDLSQLSADSGQNQDISDRSSVDDSAEESSIDELLQGGGRSNLKSSSTHGDDTDLSQSIIGAQAIEDEAETSLESADVELSESADEGVVDEDLSLLLVELEPDKSESSADTSFTDPQRPPDAERILSGDPSALEELSLVDSTENSIPAEQTDTQSPTLTNPTATALHGDDTRTSHSASTRVRVDQTSTRTYAPDNYDRTLMKLPSDDASNIFAGMKSDSDVVMTPDYAKKVFRSKTSAQRVQYYRLYLGILVVVALSISAYGFFQYQNELNQIDDSLRLLKRDPMPGVIKMAEPEKTDLFAGAEPLSNARTVEIIAGADQSASPPVEESATDQAEVVEPVMEQPDAVSVVKNETVVTKPQAEAELTPIPRTSTSQADVDQVASLDPQTTNEVYSNAAKNLQISSSNQYRKSDVWLRDAYSAYQSGDNELALRRYNQVLEVDPSNRNALLARAAIYMQNGNSDAAVRDYQALLLANPKDSMAMSSFLAVASISPQDTESQLKLMIRDDPQSPHLNFALANAYGAQKRWKDAQRHYFQALQNNPADPNYAYNLAVSLEHISQPGSAVTYYQRALDNYANGVATFSRDLVAQRMEVLGKL